MNPGSVDEIGQTARTLINSLGSTPVLLGLVVLLIVFMVGTFVVVHNAAARWEHLVEAVLTRCMPAPKG